MSANNQGNEVVLGLVKKVREKSASLSSAVGFSVDERYIVLTDEYLHCFRKEPVGSFAFQQMKILLPLPGGANDINKSSNNQVPYASIHLGTSLNFVRPYSAADTCCVFELQDSRPENAERVFAFEAASPEEMRNKWLGGIEKRRQYIRDKIRIEQTQLRLAGTPEYVKIFDQESEYQGQKGSDACRAFFSDTLQELYPQSTSSAAGKRIWDEHMNYAADILEFLEQVTFETTVAPVAVTADSSLNKVPSSLQAFSSLKVGANFGVKEAPLGRTDVLAVAFEEANATFVQRFRTVLFDTKTVEKLEAYDVQQITLRNIQRGGTMSAAGDAKERTASNGTNNKAAFISTLPLSSEIVASTGLNELHCLVAFIIKYQNRLRALQATTVANLAGGGGPYTGSRIAVPISLPIYCEVFDYLPCVYERYVNGSANASESAKGIDAKNANVVPVPKKRTSVTRRSAPAPPTAPAPVSDETAGNVLSSDGAGARLLDHCHRVWLGIRADPADAIARHMDGTFYTEGPTAVWVCLHQHLALGEDTQSTVLRVMIAEKMAISLGTLFDSMCRFVTPSTSLQIGVSASLNEKAEKEPTLDSIIMATPAVREVEVEFLCSIANDCGIHLDEVLTVVSGFNAIEGVRRHVDGTFDVVSTALMRCATTALRRLSRLVLADVASPLSELFTHNWLSPLIPAEKRKNYLPNGAVSTHGYDEMLSKAMTEGAAAVEEAEKKVDEKAAEDEGGPQIHVILQTLGDYLDDFRVYLVQFWYEKFTAMLFTSTITAYIDEIISRNRRRISCTSTAGRLSGLVGSNTAMAGAVPVDKLCQVDTRSIAKIRSDMAALQVYISRFNRRTNSYGGVNAAKYTEQLHIFCLLLECDFSRTDIAATDFGKAVIAAVQLYPFAVLQLKAFLTAALTCRSDVKPKERDALMDLFKAPSALANGTATASDAKERDRMQRQQQLEQAVGLVLALNNFMATSVHTKTERDASQSGIEQRQTIAPTGIFTSSLTALRSLLSSPANSKYEQSANPAKVPNGKSANALRRNSGGDTLTNAATVAATASADARNPRGLSEDVQRLIREHEAVQLQEAQLAEQKEVEASRALDVGFLHYTGTLDKRAEGTSLWQRRFLRLQSRKNESIDAHNGNSVRVFHTLLWFKHQGGAVLGSIELTDIISLVLRASARPLEFQPDDDQVRLVGGPGAIGLPIQFAAKSGHEESDDDDNGQDEGGADGLFILRVTVRGRGQSFDLRSADVDVFVRWTNVLATAGGLSYDPDTREWSRSGREALASLTATWKKQGVFAQKEVTAMSAIQMAKAQQRKEKAEREKLAAVAVKPQSAAAVIAAAKLQQLGDLGETLNPMLTLHKPMAKISPENDKEHEKGKDTEQSPDIGLPQPQRLVSSTSVDSFRPLPAPIKPKMMLSLQLPSAITQPVVVVEDDSPVRGAVGFAQKTPKAASTSNLIDLQNQPSFSISHNAVQPNEEMSETSTPVSIDKADMPQGNRRRLSSAEMPPPRRSSLKGSTIQMGTLLTSGHFGVESVEESDQEDRMSESSVHSDYSYSSRESTQSTSSVASAISSSSEKSFSGNRRKTVSFSHNEVREYEPRAPPEETLNSPVKEVPQRYTLNDVERLPLPPLAKLRKNKSGQVEDDPSDYDEFGKRIRPAKKGFCACM